MNRIQKINQFWNSFGLVAMDENSVPDGTMDRESPNFLGQYITYDVTDSGWDNEVPMMANIWYLSDSWQAITEKSMQIGDYIGRGGIMLDCDEGAIWIKKAPSFAQRMANEGYDNIRRIVLSIEVEYIV